MLAGLDQVPWAELEHNFGAAGDVPALLARLTDADRCREALSELDNLLFHQGGWVCSAAPAAMPFLMAVAADPASGSRAAVIQLIGAIATEARTVSARWVDAHWPSAWAAVLPGLVALMDDTDPAVRVAASVAAAQAIDEDGAVARALRDRWQAEPDLPVRLTLVFAAGDLARSKANRGIPVTAERDWLRSLVSDADSRVAMAAVIASHWLAGGDRLPAGDVDVVIAAVRGSDPHSWRGAAYIPSEPPSTAVWWLGQELRDDLDAQTHFVTAVAADSEGYRRLGAVRTAADVLGWWRSPTEALLPLIGERTDDPVAQVRAAAVHLLAAIGGPAKGYADRIAALLDDHSLAGPHAPITVADLAVWALARFGDPRCVPDLQQRMTGPRLGFGFNAHHYGRSLPSIVSLPAIHEVLALVPDQAASLLPALRHQLRTAHPPRYQRHALAHAAAAWGPAAAPLTGELASLLDTDASELAAAALAAIGPAAASAAPLLAATAGNSQRPDRIRRTAALAHAKVTGDPELALARLESDLQGNPAAGAMIAAELGPAAAPHQDTLRALLTNRDDPANWAKVHAAYALWQITTEPDPAVAVLAAVLGTVADGVALPTARIAARYLAAIGPAASPATPVLQRILTSDRRHATNGGWRAFTEDEELRQHAAHALAQTDGATP